MGNLNPREQREAYRQNRFAEKRGLPSCRGSGFREFLIQRSLRKSLWQNQSFLTLTDGPPIRLQAVLRFDSSVMLADHRPNRILGIEHLKRRGKRKINPINTLWKSVRMTDRGIHVISELFLLSALSGCYFLNGMFVLSTHLKSLNVKSVLTGQRAGYCK